MIQNFPLQLLRFFLCITLAIMVIWALPKAFAQTETIAATVNEDAISTLDVNRRMKLIMVSSGMPDLPEIKAKLRPQILSSLIEEQIKIQESERMKLEIAPEEIDQGFATIAGQNKMTPEQFEEVLKRSGIDRATLDRQIRAQIAWSKVVQTKLRPEINITDKDIDDALERLRTNIGKTEYLAAEIFLPVDNAADENNIRQLANHLVEQVRTNQAPFYKLAQQFSKEAGAQQGGDLGWVQRGQLPEAVDAALEKMEKNTVSDAIRSDDGYYILFLRESRDISEENMPSRDEILATIGTQRLDRAQRRLYLDLKAAAFVDERLDDPQPPQSQ